MLKNKFIRNATIVFFITLFLLLFDLLLKHYLFDSIKAKQGYNDGEFDWNIKILAGRSLLHESTTFLDFIGASLPNWASTLINFSIITLFLVMTLLTKSKAIVIGLAISLAGIFGNTMDNLFHQGVRDIIVTPWWDKGTFNLADSLIVIGAVITGISFLVVTFKKS